MFGGMGQCCYDQLLWTSPVIEPGYNADWETYTYSFTADQAWTHVHFKVEIYSACFMPPADYNDPNYKNLQFQKAGGSIAGSAGGVERTLVNDKDVLTIMRYYELVEELNEVHK